MLDLKRERGKGKKKAPAGHQILSSHSIPTHPLTPFHISLSSAAYPSATNKRHRRVIWSRRNLDQGAGPTCASSSRRTAAPPSYGAASPAQGRRCVLAANHQSSSRISSSQPVHAGSRACGRRPIIASRRRDGDQLVVRSNAEGSLLLLASPGTGTGVPGFTRGGRGSKERPEEELIERPSGSLLVAGLVTRRCRRLRHVVSLSPVGGFLWWLILLSLEDGCTGMRFGRWLVIVGVLFTCRVPATSLGRM
ncbi:hypothetical protein F5X96DRAFT_186844 [Biscogniauxia mediterranea]|nr:hypothetical protein F5X96DRAFT_186844 [Biscogniauxia mediterranea]